MAFKSFLWLHAQNFNKVVPCCCIPKWITIAKTRIIFGACLAKLESKYFNSSTFITLLWLDAWTSGWTSGCRTVLYSSLGLVYIHSGYHLVREQSLVAIQKIQLVRICPCTIYKCPCSSWNHLSLKAKGIESGVDRARSIPSPRTKHQPSERRYHCGLSEASRTTAQLSWEHFLPSLHLPQYQFSSENGCFLFFFKIF